MLLVVTVFHVVDLDFTQVAVVEAPETQHLMSHQVEKVVEEQVKYHLKTQQRVMQEQQILVVVLGVSQVLLVQLQVALVVKV